jgi:hypothetical protein
MRTRCQTRVAQRKTLTEKQVVLLRWIADGCDAGVMERDFHRISAAALRNRGLVETSGRGPGWSARITQAGRDYLAQVDGPNPPTPREANVSVSERLVREVIAADGVLRVPRRGWHSAHGVNYEHRARLAARHRSVPDGKRLTVTAMERELEIALVAAQSKRRRILIDYR